MYLVYGLYYNRAMEREIIDIQVETDPAERAAKLEILVKSMTEAMSAHKEYLEKHTAAMEKLTQAIKQLDQTLKKEINLESRQTSSQVQELIKLFVEYDINPQFYHEYKMLQEAPPPSKNTQLARRRYTRKTERK